MGIPEFLRNVTRNLFFTGKGGVGKTSLACATAVTLADHGKRVLLVSTDPASNLDEVLGVSVGSQPTAIPDVARLFALNLDADEAAREYRERLVGPYRGVLPEAVVASMEEQLSGSCTVEIAAFDEFSRLLADRNTTAEFDHVVFDTAPTGTPCVCCRCPLRGVVSSTGTRAGLRASVRWPDCRRNISCTRTRCRPCPTRKRQRLCW